MSVSPTLLKALPKAELHIHLEGSILPAELEALAKRNSVVIAPEVMEQARRGFATADSEVGLALFLAVLDASRKVLITAQDFSDVVVAHLTRCAAYSVVHSEMFFDPQSHTERGISLDTVMEGLIDGKRRAAHLGVNLQFVMDVFRDRPVAEAWELLDFAEQHREHIIGIGTGLHAHTDTDWTVDFAEVFAAAEARGLHRTSHCDPDVDDVVHHMLGCIERLRVERIDHGLNALDDPRLTAAMLENHVALTSCPVWIGTPDESHRIDQVLRIRDAGITITINSDDPGLFSSRNLDQVLPAFVQAAHLTTAEAVDFVRASIRASWMPQDTKNHWLGTIDELAQKEATRSAAT